MYADFLVLFNDTIDVTRFFLDTAVYWAPLVLAVAFWNLWMRYKITNYISNIEWMTLEIKLPKEIHETPLAMEAVMNAFYQTPKDNGHDQYFKRRVRNWFSLEIVSIEGAVKFFIRTPAFFKNIIETRIYSQYPAIEIHEVPDYTKYVDYRGKKGDLDIWGAEFALVKKDAYPIKTYVDYELDNEGAKEEQKVDPMVAVIEALRSTGKGEQMWVQILVQATGDGLKSFRRFKKKEWKGEGKFGCGARAVYLAKRDAFDSSNVSALMGIFRHYQSSNLNSFKPINRYTTSFDHPWQDFKDMRMTMKKLKLFNAYKRRSWFNPPYKRKSFVLNAKELATLYHFPSGVAETPIFGKVEAKKGESPANLPTSGE